MSFLDVPPTIGVKTELDSPNSPWHEAHFASQTFVPRSTLPEPVGSPWKSPRTSMFHALISAGVAARPIPDRSGAACALAVNARPAPTSSANRNDLAAAFISVDLDVGDIAGLSDAPRLDRVVVIDRPGTARGAELVDLGLHVAGVVHRARLQDRGRAVPGPVDVEAGQCIREHRAFQPRRAPVAAAVDADVDPLHLAATRPSQAGDVVVALV